MLPLSLLLASVQSAPPPPAPAAAAAIDGVRISASLPFDKVAPGVDLQLVLDVTLPDGQAIAAAGIPGLIVQLDVPRGVVLGGEHVSGYRDLARNEFLLEPFERLVSELPASIPFTLDAPPAEGATIGINVIGYIAPEDESAGHPTAASFLRRRLELPLTARAVAREGDARDTSWSCAPELLNVGDRAPDFALPRRDGRTLRLTDLLEQGKNVIVTTYRAHW